MVGTYQVFRKEVSDDLSSKRFYILFGIIYVLTIGVAFSLFPSIVEGIQRTTNEFIFLDLFTQSPSGINFSYIQIISFLGPVIGFIFTFNSICGEDAEGTLYFSLSQPIRKDSLINGKFLSTFFVILVFLTTTIISIVGIGMIKTGTVPAGGEVIRLTFFWLSGLAYISLWAGFGLLFSIVFDDSSTSILASVAVWLFSAIFVYMIGFITGTLGYLNKINPSNMFTQSSLIILFPIKRTTGVLTMEQLIGAIPKPLSSIQSLLIVLPQIVFLVCGTLAIFLISYVIFVRREIRPS